MIEKIVKNFFLTFLEKNFDGLKFYQPLSINLSKQSNLLLPSCINHGW